MKLKLCMEVHMKLYMEICVQKVCMKDHIACMKVHIVGTNLAVNFIREKFAFKADVCRLH